MNIPMIPPVVVYVGLGACLLALFVASYQQKCSAKVFFILALRLAIGWHFLFEGMHKIHSHYVGATDWNRPFSSEPYFGTADGPLGPFVRAQSGVDPEILIKARIVATLVPEKLGSVTDGDLIKLVPRPVADEWQAYVTKFFDAYYKDDAGAAMVKKEVEVPILANYGKWIVGIDKGKESKVRYVQTDVGYTVPQRLTHIVKLEKALAELKERIEPGLGQGYGYDQTRMTAAKTELRQARNDLLADADGVLADMKRELFTRTTGKRIAEFAPPSKQFEDEAKYKELLAFTPPGGPATFDTSVPPALKDVYNTYLETVKSVYALKDDDQKKAVASADYWKQSLADWYAKGTIKGKPKDQGLPELDKQFANYKTGISNMFPADVASGVVPVTVVKPSVRMDQFTRWFIAIVGAGIFFGVFTRLNCVLACGFLVMTYLTHPPFPWLPLPPNTEGNPLFINKNAIEALALLVIAVHPTGKWLGLDSLIHRVVFGR